MDKQKVQKLVNEALAENSELFLIHLDFLADNKIYIEIDGDKGVSLNECIRISRAVEHNLDRDIEDFSLEVTSPDISKPLQVVRQYKKNIGRTLKVKTEDTKEIEGTLKQASEKSITLEWKAREPKPIGKGKITVTHRIEIPFNEILEAKVKIIF